MQLNMDTIQATIYIQDCMTTHELQQATSQDEHLQCLKEHNIKSWLENTDQISQDMRTYWTFCDDMAMFDGIILKGRYIVILESLQRQALKQLHFNHMGIKKT